MCSPFCEEPILSQGQSAAWGSQPSTPDFRGRIISHIRLGWACASPKPHHSEVRKSCLRLKQKEKKKLNFCHLESVARRARAASRSRDPEEAWMGHLRAGHHSVLFPSALLFVCLFQYVLFCVLVISVNWHTSSHIFIDLQNISYKNEPGGSDSLLTSSYWLHLWPSSYSLQLCCQTKT